MHEKDPSFWSEIFSMIPPEAKSALAAVVVSLLRILYDQKERRWQRISLESLLCGALSYALSSGISAIGLDKDLSIALGAMIGFLGVEFVRSRAYSYVSNLKKRDK